MSGERANIFISFWVYDRPRFEKYKYIQTLGSYLFIDSAKNRSTLSFNSFVVVLVCNI